jgi:predicted DNA-binding protein YlxM (UPF0122 family)
LTLVTLEERSRIALLSDFYGPLLTGRQRDLLGLYYGQDLSLGEIAAQLGVSRQAVHDLLKRTERTLDSLEQRLGLVAAFEGRSAAAAELDRLLADVAAGLPGDGALLARLSRARQLALRLGED